MGMALRPPTRRCFGGTTQTVFAQGLQRIRRARCSFLADIVGVVHVIQVPQEVPDLLTRAIGWRERGF
jgi:hypothetical protein